MVQALSLGSLYMSDTRAFLPGGMECGHTDNGASGESPILEMCEDGQE